MQQALAWAVGSGVTFYFGYKSLNETPTDASLLGIGTYKYVGGSMTNPLYTPSKGPNFTFATDYSASLRQAQQDLINESRLNQTHPILNPFKFHGESKLGEPTDTTVPPPGSWTTNAAPAAAGHDLATHYS